MWFLFTTRCSSLVGEVLSIQTLPVTTSRPLLSVSYLHVCLLAYLGFQATKWCGVLLLQAAWISVESIVQLTEINGHN